jgi:choline monooxygenase
MLDKTADSGVDFEFSDNPELAWTLPAYTYFDQQWFDREQDTIFKSNWRYLGHVGDIPGAGDYLTTSIANQPIAVLRDREGGIRAFHNVCKHRAHLLLTEPEGSISSTQITCPYHAWCYDLDGRLQSAPHCDLVREFDKSSIRLDSLGVEIINGLIFGNLDLDAPPLGPQVNSVLSRFCGLVPDMEKYRPVNSVRFDIAGNWKNVGDNLLECYHCHRAHMDFVDLIDMDTYVVETGGLWSWQSGVTREKNSAYFIPPGLNEQEREFVTLFIWPNMALVRFVGSGNFGTFVFDPVSPELTRQRFDFYTEDGVLDQVTGEICRYFNDVLGPEDVSLVETVQKGLHSRSYERGRLMIDPGRSYFSEHAVHHFQQLVVRGIGTDPVD